MHRIYLPVMDNRNRFGPCYVALVAMLWAELEEWLQAMQGRDGQCSGAGPGVDAERIEALLLELALLHECTDSFVVRKNMSPEERERMRRMVGDVWSLLDVQPFEARNDTTRVAVERTQNRLFDEAREMARSVARRRADETCEGLEFADYRIIAARLRSSGRH